VNGASPLATRRSDLTAAAEAALQCLGVGPTDDVLVLCNEEQRTIAESLALTADRPARSVRVVAYPTLTRDGEEPPPFVAEAMAEATVVFAPTTFSISHTQARLEATGRGTRIASMPGLTVEIFRRAIPVDYSDLKRAGERIAAELSAASTCRITSPAGTDVVLSLEGRTAVCDDGNLQAEGAWGNLPAGEAFIAPIETRGEGSIVFDGALAGYGMLREPLRVTLAGGGAIDADGKAAQWLLDTLDAGGPTGRLIAELGIGTNPRATLTGHILEDEKAVGTAHFAFGTSASFGGTNVSTVHIDGILLQPTVELDERLLIRNGELLNSRETQTASG
jgi:leucyl aminopeptidase (aminopeptidase T)